VVNVSRPLTMIQILLCKQEMHLPEMRLIIRSYAGFTPSSTYLFSSTLSSVLRIYNIHTSNVLKTFRHASYVSERFPCPAIVYERPRQPKSDPTEAMNIDETPKAEAWLVSGSENGKIVIWDVGSRNVVGILEGHERPVVALAVSPDGRRIAGGSLEPEKTIRTWEVVGGDR
jgi:COMPASS component SWD3